MKYQRIFELLTITSMILTTSCSNTSDLTDAIKDEDPCTMAISLEEALGNADRFFGIIEGKTRSNRRIKSVERFTCSGGTRSGEYSSIGYYIVNYEEDKGFAVLSADRRLGTVFAIGEEGEISLSDTVNNHTLGTFFNELNRMTSTLQFRDSITVVPSFPNDSLNNVVLIKQVTPRIPKNITKWPGNECYGVLGKYSKLTIAMAQIMATFKHPQTWTVSRSGSHTDIFTPSWEIISSFQFPTSNNSIYNPTHFEYVNYFFKLMEDSFGSKIYPGEIDFDDQLEDCNFRIHQIRVPGFHADDPGWEQPWGADRKIIEFLNDGDILLMSNFRTDETQEIWLVDGYLMFNNKIAVINETDVDFMCHCVWGKGGKGNGYYVIFNSMLSNPYRLDNGSTPIELEDTSSVCMVGFYYDSSK